MPLVPRPTSSYSPNTTIKSAEVNADLNALYNLVNGNLDSANLSGSAGITGNQINLSSPGAIGATAPSTGKFTTLEATTSLKLAAGATVTELSTDGTLAGDSDVAVPTEKAVKTYIDATNPSGVPIQTIMSVVTAYTKTIGVAAIPSDDTIPQNTEGAEVITCAITPKSASNYLVFDANIFISSDGSGGEYLTLAMFMDSDANAIAVNSSFVYFGNYIHTLRLRAYLQAPGTGTYTYKIRFGANDVSTIYVNGQAFSNSRLFGGVGQCTFSITELKA